MASSDREEIDKLLAPLIEGGFTEKSTEEAPDGGCQALLPLTKRRDDDGQGKPSPLSDYHLERINQQGDGQERCAEIGEVNESIWGCRLG